MYRQVEKEFHILFFTFSLSDKLVLNQKRQYDNFPEKNCKEQNNKNRID